MPTLALAFLRPSNRPWVSFTKLGEEDFDGVPVWVIGYQETMSDGPTILAWQPLDIDDDKPLTGTAQSADTG